MKNRYARKTATKEGSCDLCFKPTANVLRNELDWFYLCLSHLSEPLFCKPEILIPPPSVSSVKEEKKEDQDKPENTDEKETEDKGKQEEEKVLSRWWILDHRIFGFTLFVNSQNLD